MGSVPLWMDAFVKHSPPTPCCAEVRLTIGDYVEGELDETRAAKTKDHLRQCPTCEILVQKLMNASAACRAHLLKQVPNGLEDRLMSFLRKKCGAKEAPDSGAPSDGDTPSGDF